MENGLEKRQNSTKRIALAHDFLVTWGGAERVFQVFADMYPEAPIYTLFYDEALVRVRFPGREIRTSFLQKFPRWLRQSPLFMPLYPIAVETLDLRDFDIVLSSSGAWMKGLVTRLYTKHISYLHSPMRFVWDTYHEHPGFKSGFRFCKRLLVSYLRLWDKEAADRPDVILVNSGYTAKRVAKYYHREGKVIYPPVSFGENSLTATSTQEKQSFLVVARLTASKHVDIVIEAFNKLGLPLTIIGTGKEEKYLRNIAEKNITFLGAVDDKMLLDTYRNSRAVIQPSEEDFGLVALEALSFGVPVIAYKEGAVREIIVPGKTGELFDDLVPESIADGVRRFIAEENQYDTASFDRATFTREKFETEIRSAVTSTSS